MISQQEKDFIQLRFGLTLKRILDQNSNRAKDNKSRGIKEHKLISSLRQLEASTELRFATIQQVSTGNVNASLTTIVAIAEALDIPLHELFIRYEQITTREVNEYREKLRLAQDERKRKKKAKKK